jgi:5-methylcytosine-specific restriction protein B
MSDMNAQVAFQHLEELVRSEVLQRASGEDRLSKAMIYSVSRRFFALELGGVTLTWANEKLEPVDGSKFAKKSQIVMQALPEGIALNWQAANQLAGVAVQDDKSLASTGYGGSYGLDQKSQKIAYVDSIEALDRLIDWYASGLAFDRAALEALKEKFLAQHSDFQSFADCPSFADEEGDYKRALVTRAGEIFGAASELDDAALGTELLRLVRGRGGLESNLIDRWISATIDKVAKHSPGMIEAATGMLVRAENGLLATVQWIEAIWPLMIAAIDKQPYPATRTIPTLIRALIDPHVIFPIRSEPTDNMGRRLLKHRAFGNNPMTADEFAVVNSLGLELLRVMHDEWHWAPRDLWDVQGFIWETCQSASDTAQPTPPPEPEFEDPYMALPTPTNLILYGPPGTGKTYATAYEAVRLCDPEAIADNGDVLYPDTVEGRMRWLGSGKARKTLMTRYNELRRGKRIEFVTFHQSYDYESFVEGLRPETAPDAASGGAGFRLVPQPGSFREIAHLAEEAASPATGENAQPGARFELGTRQVFKMSLGRGGSEEHIYDDAIENNTISLGWGGEIDWTPFNSYEAVHARWNQDHPGTNGNDSNITQIYRFRVSMKPGDIVLVSAGNTSIRAIAEVVADYDYDPQAEFRNRRSVRWLKVFDDPIAVDTFYDRDFTPRTCYLLKEMYLKREALQTLLAGVAAAPSEDIQDPATEWTPSATLPQFVLIIDEINRGNISKIFGELITLIEPDKRIGMENALTVTLPYSKRAFGVPANLHIVGTMNTADRSIALLDTALRRRFVFREMAPDPSLLAAAAAESGLPLLAMLTTINARIEYLLDREHRIGHAFFMGCKDKAGIDAVMRHKVIPLLQEYFFEDFARVHAVLGKGFITSSDLLPPPGFEGRGDVRQSWSVRETFPDIAYFTLAGTTPTIDPAGAQE